MKKAYLFLFFYSIVFIGNAAVDTLTRLQVYNFNVGDTFDYEYIGFSSIPNFGSNYHNYGRSIIEGVSLIGLDTLIIKRKNSNGVQMTHDSLIMTMVDSFEATQYFLNLLPCTPEIFIEPNSQYGNTTMNRCRSVSPDGLGCGQDSSFAEGLGVVHTADGYGDGFGGIVSWQTNLIYFSKGGNTWGSPVTIQCNANFSLYPSTAIQHEYIAYNHASGVGQLNYVWDWGDGTFDSTAYPNHTYASAGLYTICLTITDAFGCFDSYCNNFNLQRTTNTIVTVTVVPGSTGIQFIVATPQFDISPNPASEQVTITIPETLLGETIKIRDIRGIIILEERLRDLKSKIETDRFANGIYFVQIGDTVKKLIVNGMP